MVVVRLVVLVPVVTRLDTVEVAWFSRAELVVPPVCLPKRNRAAVLSESLAEGNMAKGEISITRWCGTLRDSCSQRSFNRRTRACTAPKCDKSLRVNSFF